MSERRLSDAELARLEDMTFLEALGTTPGHQLFKLAIAELKSRRATPTPDVVLVPKEPTDEMIHQATLAAVRENGGMELSIYKMWQAMLLASPSSGSARDK